MFDTFRNMDLKYKILVLASSAIAVVIMLSVLVTVISNIVAQNSNQSQIDNGSQPSQSVSPSEDIVTPSPSASIIEDIPADDNTSDSDEMGIVYDVPLTSDEQVELLQFAESAYAKLCKLDAGESYNSHYESVKTLFNEPDKYKNTIELYVKPSDTQKCITSSSTIIGYESESGYYGVFLTGFKNRTYNGVSSEDSLSMTLFIKYDSNKPMKIYDVR